MIVFNEGIPRAGKSYDAMKHHVIPAIIAGRTVYARLNGMDDPVRRKAIADYCNVSEEVLNERLIHVTTAQVPQVFLAQKNEDGEWTIPASLRDSLSVIDECHSFYVASREAINPAIEEFFALIGQNGGDVVLMTQFYRRLHSSVRARIERKNLFQKLTAVGMLKKYTVTRYHALGPDRFEKVTTDTETYDPKIFPLYKGYADGSSNKEVYKAGGKTVWAKIRVYALVIVPLVIAAVYCFTGFFHGDGGMVHNKTAHASTHSSATVHRASLDGSDLLPGTSAAGRVVMKHHGKMSEEQGYVFDLTDKTRPRLAALISTQGQQPVGLVEWREQAGQVLDRLTFAQLRDLGVRVEVHTYGVRLVAGKDSTVVTAWPLDVPPVQQSQDGQAVSSSASTAVLPAVADASPRNDGTLWPSSDISHDYTPPQLLKHPSQSTWSMH